MGATPVNVKYIGLDNVIMWQVQPEILVSDPAVTQNQVVVPFVLSRGSAATYNLQQTSDPAGPWTNVNVNPTVIETNVSYSFSLPMTGEMRFYRIRAH
jgi:hypothetical protein